MGILRFAIVCGFLISSNAPIECHAYEFGGDGDSPAFKSAKSVIVVAQTTPILPHMADMKGSFTRTACYADGGVSPILTYIEGSLGALVMLFFGVCGIGMMIIAAFTKRKAHVLCGGLFFLLTIGVFILRLLISTFFNSENIIIS